MMKKMEKNEIIRENDITLDDIYDILDDVWYEVNKLRWMFLIIYFIVLCHFLFFMWFIYHLFF